MTLGRGHIRTAIYTLLVLLEHSATTQAQNCINGEIDAVTGFPSDGRLYIRYCFNGDWRRICTNSGSWTPNTAKVACRQLGYSDMNAQPGSSCPDPTTMVTQTVMVRLQASCEGHENRIEDCHSGVTQSSCSCRSQAWVRCEPGCTNGTLRLVGGSTDREGRVEVCVGGRWGTVCGDGWTDREAGLVCSRLGYPQEGAREVRMFGAGFVPINNCSISATNVRCLPLIDGLACNHTMDSGVICASFQEAYNITRVALDQLQEQCLTTEAITATTTTTTQPNTNSERITDSVSCNTTVYEVFLGVLIAVIVAMTMGWIITCMVMKRKSGINKINGGRFEVKNPIYDDTVLANRNKELHQTEAIALKRHDNEVKPATLELSYSEDERGFENPDYESVDGEEEPTYSVVARKMVTQGGRDAEYNTLVQSGDHGDKMQFEIDSLHREGSYSKLLMSQQS
ncbi:deleted in malignant brain tumors 1 protein-like isoform X3 [Halichondria panicea]|uniref:deleted in malignant brain tumors 1 protein-like isoform X3 n=1 Tax=Halichondria panicea TaxID=6063 RepID=UPI00312BBA05